VPSATAFSLRRLIFTGRGGIGLEGDLHDTKNLGCPGSGTITLVTTLLDPVSYPAGGALAELYLGRWQVETNLRHLKTTMGLEVLHCKTVAGVLKEMYMFAITYNLVRLIMLEASRRQQVPLARISFIDAMRWLRDAKADTRLTALLLNPLRSNRLEPGVLKRRPKEYARMTKPRDALRKALLSKKHAA
jgi:hypothetical protein